MQGIDFLEFRIGGKKVPAPVEWLDLTIRANIGEDGQASVETQELTWVREANDLIREAITSGTTGGLGIFEGPELIITQSNKSSSYDSFVGFLDLTTFRSIDEARCSCQIRYDNSKDVFVQTLVDLTYGFLQEEGVFNDSDFDEIKFSVETRRNFLELATSFLMFLQLRKELADSIERTSKTIADAVAHLTGGITGPVAAAVYAVAVALLDIVYTAFILALILQVFTEFLRNYFPLVLPKHKITSYRKLLEKPLGFMGLKLYTNLPLDQEAYLPSNKEGTDNQIISFRVVPKGVKNGLPKIDEPAYNVGGLLEDIEKRFNAKWIIKDDGFFIYTEDDDFFRKQSGYNVPSTQAEEAFRYNVDELVNNWIIEYLTDFSDDFTVDNFKGTSYQVTTQPESFVKRQRVGIKGTNIVTIPTALGTRKDELNNLEQFMLFVAQAAESVVNLFGGNADFTSQIKARIGTLKQSSEFHKVPKRLRISNGIMPANHRELLSAKETWNKYYKNKSFIENNYRSQNVIFEEVRVGFTFADFLQNVENSYCKNSKGEIARITSFDYQPYAGAASLNYKVERPYYTSLKEIKIEPQ